MGELEIEARQADHHQDKGDVGVGDVLQYPEAQAFGNFLDRHPGGVEDQLLASHFDFPAVDFGQEVFQIVGHEVHDLELHGLGGGDGDALADRLFHPIGVAAPLAGQGPPRRPPCR